MAAGETALRERFDLGRRLRELERIAPQLAEEGTLRQRFVEIRDGFLGAHGLPEGIAVGVALATRPELRCPPQGLLCPSRLVAASTTEGS